MENDKNVSANEKIRYLVIYKEPHRKKMKSQQKNKQIMKKY